MTVRWLASARADVAAIARHIADENPIAARRLARELLVAGDSLVAFPHRGRRGAVAGTRELTVIRPYVIRPYVIVYRVSQSGDVAVLRVWHAAQDR